jgi:hypothetical protein
MLWKLILLQFDFWIELQSFKQKIKNKRELSKRSLDEQGQHLCPRDVVLRMAQARREREHLHKTTIR